MIYITYFFLSLLAFGTETRNKIAVVDTGIIHSKYIDKYLCKDESADFTSTSLVDNIGHGTVVAWLIAKRIDPEKSCLLIVKWTDSATDCDYMPILFSLEYILTLENIKVINMSYYGGRAINSEKHLLETILKKNIIGVTVSGNDGKDLDKSCDVYPACYYLKDNFYVVASYKGRKRNLTSNYNGPTNAKQNGDKVSIAGFKMSGTSMSAAIKTSRIARGLEK